MSTTLSEQGRAFLNEKRFAVLATLNSDGSIQQTTMWYLLDGDTIIMNTQAGRIKERNLRRDPRYSICIENGYNYLTISGKVELIDDPEIARRDIHRLAVRYNGEGEATDKMAEDYARTKRVTLHLHIERVNEYL